MALARCPGTGLPAPPPPLRRAPGPVLVVAARYATSPVGPYRELAVAQPVRLGLRLATCAAAMVVDSAGSRDAGRRSWGLPTEMGTLHWSVEGDDVSLRWEEGGVAVTSHPAGPRFPVVIPFRSLQTLAGTPVHFGGRARGTGRFSLIDVAVEAGSPLACLAGRHRALHLTEAATRMGEARLVPPTLVTRR